MWAIRSRLLISSERCERIVKVAHQKWAMWANHSGRSPEMSNHERFAQVAQSKWAIVSESLRSLTKNERMSELLIFWAKRSFAHFWAKTSDLLGKSMSEFTTLSLSYYYGVFYLIIFIDYAILIFFGLHSVSIFLIPPHFFFVPTSFQLSTFFLPF